MKKIFLIILFLSITPLTQATEKTLYHYTNLTFVLELPEQFKRVCYYQRNKETFLRVTKNIKDNCSYRLTYEVEDSREIRVLVEHMDKNAIDFEIVK